MTSVAPNSRPRSVRSVCRPMLGAERSLTAVHAGGTPLPAVPARGEQGRQQPATCSWRTCRPDADRTNRRRGARALRLAAVLLVGNEIRDRPRMRDGSSPAARTSYQASPVNVSAGALVVGGFGWRFNWLLRWCWPRAYGRSVRSDRSSVAAQLASSSSASWVGVPASAV